MALFFLSEGAVVPQLLFVETGGIGQLSDFGALLQAPWRVLYVMVR